MMLAIMENARVKLFLWGEGLNPLCLPWDLIFKFNFDSDNSRTQGCLLVNQQVNVNVNVSQQVNS